MSEPSPPRPARPPPEVRELAARRADARRSGDFGAADELRSQVEAAGWKLIDRGYDYALEPVGPSATVESRLGEPDSAPATVVVVASDGGPAALAGVLPPDTQIVLLGDRAAELPEGAEAVETARPVGLGEAWNIGLRRSVGSIVILLGEGIRPTSDIVTPVTVALADETVAVAGATGLASHDLRRWEPAPAGDVDALAGDLVAFRRADAALRGPLDERFHGPRLLAVWWSLVLRDEGEGRPPRRAVSLELPLARDGRHATRDAAADVGAQDDRAARRDTYRIIGRFGRRYDLLRQPLEPVRPR